MQEDRDYALTFEPNHRTADPTLCPECGGRGCVGHETEGPCWMCGGWNDEKRKRLKEQEEGIRCCGGCPDCLGIGAGEQIASLTRDNARLRAFLRHTLQRIDEALAR